jgi:hypothetical protein
MSWAVEVTILIKNEWVGNYVRLATKEEAIAYSRDLFSRWAQTSDSRVVESPDPVNYVFTKEGLKPTAYGDYNP